MGTGTGIGRVRGLGSAKHGAHHWLAQRYTAIGNLLLVLWLLFSLIALPGLDYESVVNWIHNPLVAVPLMLLVLSVFWHARLGVQVLIETSALIRDLSARARTHAADYIDRRWLAEARASL
jgi:succinate dehydrogenase / fumarate reductase membrane anchor subunit